MPSPAALRLRNVCSRWRRPAAGGPRALLAVALLSLSACSVLPTTNTVMVGDNAEVSVSRLGPSYPTSADGRPEPVVVLQSGLGDSRQPWLGVARELARQRHAVFSYDRPGYGNSPGVDGPRDPCSVASELHALLQASRVDPPYLLVGHSLGGLYQHAFARMYPQDVAGLLLLDPTHPEHLAGMKRDTPTLAATVTGMRYLTFVPAARREFDDQAGCNTRLMGPPTLPVPTRLLVSTKRSPLESSDFAALLERLRTDWLQLTGATAVEPLAGAGHYLQKERPAEVVKAVNEMLASPR